MTQPEAINIIARAVAAEVLRDHADHKWEDHPLVGEFDWYEIDEAVEELSKEMSPTTADYDEAYAFLAARTEDNA